MLIFKFRSELVRLLLQQSSYAKKLEERGFRAFLSLKSLITSLSEDNESTDFSEYLLDLKSSMIGRGFYTRKHNGRHGIFTRLLNIDSKVDKRLLKFESELASLKSFEIDYFNIDNSNKLEPVERLCKVQSLVKQSFLERFKSSLGPTKTRLFAIPMTTEFKLIAKIDKVALQRNDKFRLVLSYGLQKGNKELKNSFFDLNLFFNTEIPGMPFIYSLCENNEDLCLAIQLHIEMLDIVKDDIKSALVNSL